MHDALLGIIILFLAINIFVTVVLRKTNVYNLFDLIIIFFSIVMILYALYTIYNNNFVEKFDQNATSTIEDEDISQFVNGLTIYVSSISKKSYPSPTRTWYNISKFFENGTCSSVRTADTNFNFSYIPAYESSNGFLLGNNMLVGPMCHQLGITANDSFSIVFTFKLTEFVAEPENDLEIIKLFANTENNKGLVLYIPKQYSINNELITCKMILEYANLSFQLDIPVLNTSYTYMMAIVKQNFNIKVMIYPDITDLAINSSVKHIALNTPIDKNIDVLLSNKELVVNRNKNLPINLYNILFYNKGITDITLNEIYIHIQKYLHQANQIIINFNKQIEDLRNQIENAKRCSYDDATCKLCSSVSNWNDMVDIVTKATPECLNAVNQFCKNNPKHPKCVCWDAQNNLSTTDSCKAYVSLFSKDVNIEKIKADYNLCPCGSGSQTNDTPVIPQPKLMNNAYDVKGKSDIQLYYELPVI